MLNTTQLRAVYDTALTEAASEHVGQARLSVFDASRDQGIALQAVQAAVLDDARALIEAGLARPAAKTEADPDADATVDPQDTERSLDRLAAVLDEAYASGASAVIFNRSGVWASGADKVSLIHCTTLSVFDMALWDRAVRAGHPRFDGNGSDAYFTTPTHRTRAAFVREGRDLSVSFHKAHDFGGARIVRLRPTTEEELGDVR